LPTIIDEQKMNTKTIKQDQEFFNDDLIFENAQKLGGKKRDMGFNKKNN